MEKLKIEGTKSTPTVFFDPVNHKLLIKGQSYPENAFGFYDPLYEWIDHYLVELKGDSTVEIELNLPYINTSSTKCFFMLLEKLEQAYSKGKGITIYWYYDEENESELECAEEFKEDFSLPFHIIPKTDR